MSDFNIMQPESVEVAADIQRSSFIPENVVRVMARDLAGSAKDKILGRVKNGHFPGNPDGTGPTRTQQYSDEEAAFPLRRVNDKSRTRTRRYNRLGRRVESRAGSNGTNVFQRGGNPWIYVPGGYAQFRSMAGRSTGMVNLSLTGRLLEDLVVKPTIERYGEENMNRAAMMVGGGIGGTSAGYSKAFDMDFGLAGIIASIHMNIGFSTQSSWRIARHQADTYDRHFALLTPEEKTDLQREVLRLALTAREKYGASSPSVAPRDDQGQFIPIRL
jgi:hypothetical protein